MTFKARLLTLHRTTTSLEELLVFMTTKRSKFLLTTNSYHFSSRFGQSIYHCSKTLSNDSFVRYFLKLIFVSLFPFRFLLITNLETGSSTLRYAHCPLPVMTINTTHLNRQHLFLPHLLPTHLPRPYRPHPHLLPTGRVPG